MNEELLDKSDPQDFGSYHELIKLDSLGSKGFDLR
jgi:hypothetical protein